MYSRLVLLIFASPLLFILIILALFLVGNISNMTSWIWWNGVIAGILIGPLFRELKEAWRIWRKECLDMKMQDVRDRVAELEDTFLSPDFPQMARKAVAYAKKVAKKHGLRLNQLYLTQKKVDFLLESAQEAEVLFTQSRINPAREKVIQDAVDSWVKKEGDSVVWVDKEFLSRHASEIGFPPQEMEIWFDQTEGKQEKNLEYLEQLAKLDEEWLKEARGEKDSSSKCPA